MHTRKCFEDRNLRKMDMLNPPPKPIRALIVDDDENFAALVRDVLGLAESLHLERVAGAREMWARLETDSFDVVLLDYDLPDGNGLEILKGLAERDVDVPVVFITGRGDERTAAQAIQLGAIDYHVKSHETVFELPVLIRKAVRNHAYRVESKKSLEHIRYQALLLDNVRDAVVVWDADGRITFWNAAAEELYGATAAERLGRPVADEYLRLFEPAPQPHPEGGSANVVERLVKNRDGRERWIDSRITALCGGAGGANGTCAGYMDVTRDVTVRRAGEIELRHRLEFEKLITSLSTEFISLPTGQIDEHILETLAAVGRFVMVDRAYVFLFSEDGLRMRNTHEWCAPGVPPHQDRQQNSALDLLPWFAEQIRARRVVQVQSLQALPPEAAAERAEWTRGAVGALINVPMVYEGKPVGFLGLESLRADHAWTESTTALLTIVGEILLGALLRQRADVRIHDAQNRLVQTARLSAFGELASGVAHQINNPLTAIIAEAQILQREQGGGDSVRESADVIERAGWKAQEAVQHLLEFSRSTPDSLRTLSVNETVQKALRLVGTPIQSAGIRLDILLAEHLPPVRGFAGQLEDLWLNLLLLARDGASDGKPHYITVRSFTSGENQVAVEVSDDGSLVPPEEMDTLFEPHFTGPVAGRGSGMEFSICREIARQHGGEIRASSSPDFGTIIRVTIPSEVPHGTGGYSGH
jgi:PAS domain S-box-containing protein